VHGEVARILNDEEADVHADNYDIYPYEMEEHAARVLAAVAVQIETNFAGLPDYGGSLPDIEAGDDEFLDEEDGDLDVGIDGVGSQPDCGPVTVGAEGEDGDRDVADEGVNNYHSQNPTQSLAVIDDEMET